MATYYIQCPHCGEIYETTNFIPREDVCPICRRAFKVNKTNYVKRPPYNFLYCVCMLILAGGACVVSRVFNGYAPETDLIYALICICLSLSLMITVDAFSRWYRKLLRVCSIKLVKECEYKNKVRETRK